MILFTALVLGLATYLTFPLPAFSQLSHPMNAKKKIKDSHNTKQDNVSISSVLLTLQFLRMCLSSGMTILDAITFICPQLPRDARQDLESVLDQFNLGKPLTFALEVLPARSPLWQSLTDSLVAASVSGSPIHDQLAELEQVLQTSVDIAKLKRIKSVAVKSVLPLGLCFLPAFILLAVVPLVAGLLSNFLNNPQ